MIHTGAIEVSSLVKQSFDCELTGLAVAQLSSGLSALPTSLYNHRFEDHTSGLKHG